MINPLKWLWEKYIELLVKSRLWARNLGEKYGKKTGMHDFTDKTIKEFNNKKKKIKKFEKKTENYIIIFGGLSDFISIILIWILYFIQYKSMGLNLKIFLFYMLMHITGVLFEMMNERYKYVVKDKSDLKTRIDKFLRPKKYL